MAIRTLDRHILVWIRGGSRSTIAGMERALPFESGIRTKMAMRVARRKAEEAGYVVTGILEIEIAGTWHRLEAGDSFRFRDEPFRWRNPGTDPAVLIRVVSPPTY